MIAVAAGLNAPCLDSDSDSDRVPETTPKKHGGGPRTPEGKERSQRNALRHGMLAEVVFPDDLAAAIANRTAELVDEFVPATPYEAFLVGEMAKATAKLDRCSEMAIVDLQRVQRPRRALLGRRPAGGCRGPRARLPRDPARVAQALGRTQQGVDWLLERWEGLGAVLRAQRRLGRAAAPAGVRPARRAGGAPRRQPQGPARGRRRGAGRAGRRGRSPGCGTSRRRALIELDEATRSMAAAGMPLEEDAATARLRKYEAAARRALLWAHSELRRVRSGHPSPRGRLAPSPPADATGAAADYLVNQAKLLYAAVLPRDASRGTRRRRDASRPRSGGIDPDPRQGIRRRRRVRRPPTGRLAWRPRRRSRCRRRRRRGTVTSVRPRRNGTARPLAAGPAD